MTGTQLGIGTVQLGGAYGAVDNLVVPDDAEAHELIFTALDHQVAFFDTAATYGDAETILGRHLPKNCPAHIVTKLPPLPEDCPDVSACVKKQVALSTARLGENMPGTVMIHHPEDATGPQALQIVDALNDLKAAGMIQQVGVSLYDEDEISQFPGLDGTDCLQLPINVLDQRLFRSGTLMQLHDRGIEIMARSAFLQGLLLIPSSEMPGRLSGLTEFVDKFHQQAARMEISPMALCLGFLKASPEVDSVVVGVKTTEQLRMILAAWDVQPPAVDWAAFAASDCPLLDPRHWPV